MEIFYRLFLPPDFMKKEVNESVVFAMLKAAKNFQVSRRGIPPEPDFIADGEGIEVTFAAGREASRDFIRQTCDGRFDPGAGKAGEIERIKSALSRKAEKFYSTRRTSLAILCMLELFDWAAGESREREKFFRWIRREYIDAGIFHTVYLLLPSLNQEWFVYDLRREERRRLLILNYLQAPYYTVVNKGGTGG